VNAVANSVKAEVSWSDRSMVRHPRWRCCRLWRRSWLVGSSKRGETQYKTPGAAHKDCGAVGESN
jgi:hypothetical protein